MIPECLKFKRNSFEICFDKALRRKTFLKGTLRRLHNKTSSSSHNLTQQKEEEYYANIYANIGLLVLHSFYSSKKKLLYEYDLERTQWHICWQLHIICTYAGVYVNRKIWDNRKWWLIYISSVLWPGKYAYPIIILRTQILVSLKVYSFHKVLSIFNNQMIVIKYPW